MKLFIIAALIAVAAAGRLEHLENAYLPPFGSEGQGQGSHGAHGSQGSQGSFGAQGSQGFGSQGSQGFGSQGSQGFGSQGSQGFGSQESHGSGSQSHSALHGSQDFGTQSFGAQGPQGAFGAQGFGGASAKSSAFGAATSNQYLPPDHGPSGAASFGAASNAQPSQFGSYSNQGQFGGFGAQGQAQPARYQQNPTASRQYLAPKTQNNFQNIPQQAFDEQTGYHY